MNKLLVPQPRPQTISWTLWVPPAVSTVSHWAPDLGSSSSILSSAQPRDPGLTLILLNLFSHDYCPQSEQPDSDLYGSRLGHWGAETVLATFHEASITSRLAATSLEGDAAPQFYTSSYYSLPLGGADHTLLGIRAPDLYYLKHVKYPSFSLLPPSAPE